MKIEKKKPYTTDWILWGKEKLFFLDYIVEPIRELINAVEYFIVVPPEDMDACGRAIEGVDSALENALEFYMNP